MSRTSRKPILERTCWFVIVTICLIVSGYCVFEAYSRWAQSPVIVNFANHGTPVTQIPFPAITVCPEWKADPSKLNYTDLVRKIKNNDTLTSTENFHYQYMAMVCKSVTDEYENSPNSMIPFDINTFFDIADNVKPSFFIENCHFLNFNDACTKVFIPILTDEGVCYTFNMIDRSEIFRENVLQHGDFHGVSTKSTWTLQDGYGDNQETFTYPRRVLSVGAKNGLSFNLVSLREDKENVCESSSRGYRITLHSPETIPRPSQSFFVVPSNRRVVATIQPTATTTSKRVQKYSPERRKCYFENERPLQYFKKYSASNCQLECLANFSLRNPLVTCAPYFMPRSDEADKLCTVRQYRFSRTIQVQLSLSEGHSETQHEEKAEKGFCQCLPTCSDLSYDVETSLTDWRSDENETHVASVTLFFKSSHFLTTERNELYGPIDFVANFGGLVALFTGFSVLSIVETVYLVVVRLVKKKCIRE